MKDTNEVRPLRVGIVGAGLICDLHIQGVRALEDVEVVAIADSDLPRARAKAEDHGIPGCFATQAALLEEAEPDVVHLLTPPASHAALAVEALSAGAHVYVEKPMAATEAECARMIEEARRVGRELCVGHSLVYDPLMRQALEAIAEGEIGDVLHARGVYCFDPQRIPGYRNKRWYRRLGGGFLEDLAAHPASVLLRVIGAPDEIVGTTGKGDGEAETGVEAVIRGERGTGSLLVSLDARPEEVSLEIRGTRGLVRVNFSTMVVSVQGEGRLPKKLSHGARNLGFAADLAVQTVTNTARFMTKRMDTTKGLHTLIGEFYSGLREGRPAPVSGEDGRHVVSLIRKLWPAEATEPPRRWLLSQFDGGVGAEAREERVVALVTGATGFIGTHLVRALVDRGVRVRILARDPEKARPLVGPDVEAVIGDFADPEVVEGLAEGADAIYHLASVMVGSEDEFRRVDLEGTERLLEEAKRAGVKRIVYTSTLGVYPFGDLQDSEVVSHATPVDESSRTGPYSAAKIRIERLLMESNRKGEIEAVVVRPGLVFGPGTTPYLTHLPHVGTRVGDRYIVYGDGRVPLALTYVGNVVDALILCAEVPEAAGETFLLVDDDIPTQREFVERLAELTGDPLRVTAIPRAAVGLLGFGLESAFRLRGKPAKTTRRLLVGKSYKFQFDASHAKRVLGWDPAVSWQEGLRRNVRWWERTPEGNEA